MCTCYGSFRVKAKGVMYERVHTGIDLYMRVHIIQRYDDTMKEKGEEEGERKERHIYIYKIYRWPPPVCNVVSLRQHALLLCACALYTCTYPRTPTHIYKRIPS